MTKRTRVNIEDVREFLRLKKLINTAQIVDVDFYEVDVKLPVAQEILEDFKYSGLNNTDFVRSFFFLGEDFYTIITCTKEQ